MKYFSSVSEVCRRAIACLLAFTMLMTCAGFAAFAEDVMPAQPAVDEDDADISIDEYAMQLEETLDDVDEENDDTIYDPEEETALDALNLDYEEALSAVNGMTNILLIGLDARPKQNTGRSDTMILMTLDADHECIKMTSFMRDLYVEIPGHKNNRLNAAYVFGGANLLIKTLKANFGVDVDYYVAVNFSVLADVIDQIGGLELTISSKKQMKYINLVIMEDNVVLKKAYPKQGVKTKDNLLTEVGTYVLNGRQAQAYARYRKGESDFQRTIRQREVVLKCLEKVQDMGTTELVKLAINNLDNIVTDMSLIDIMSLVPAAFALRSKEIRELRVPIDGKYSSKTVSGMAVLVPKRSSTAKAITKFLLEE